MSATKQRGFSAVEITIAIFIAAAIGVTGYLAYDRMQEANNTPTAAEQTEKATTPEAPAISDSADLDQAARALDETNLDASATDTTELDAELNNF